MKEFLEKLKGSNLSAKHAFAFDTRLDWRLSGSAAKFMEKELKALGLQVIAPCESAIVSVLKERGAIVGARIKEGEEERLEQVGRRVGTALADRVRMIPA